MNKILVANWKQNKNKNEVKKWLDDFEVIIDGFEPNNLDVVICPPFLYMYLVEDFSEKYDWIYVGAQDVSVFKGGSHTGEISSDQLSDFAKFCIVGHSERGEPDEIVLRKTKACIDKSIVPIVCFSDLKRLELFSGIRAFYLWEDPSTISKNGHFSAKPISDIKKNVKKITSRYDVGRGLLYGGSINWENIDKISKVVGLSGGVSGGASLDPDHFFNLIEKMDG